MSVARLWLASLASMLLVGCWTGANLYSTADAVPVIPSGIYRAQGAEHEGRVYRITTLKNGLTQFGTGEKTEVYGFAPLGSKRAMFVAWLQVDHESDTGENQIYSLMVGRPDQSFAIYAPDCQGDTAQIAERAGATITSAGSPTCRFPTRASLEKALPLIPRDDPLVLERVR